MTRLSSKLSPDTIAKLNARTPAVVTQKYVRKPFEVDAVKITEDNLTEVAEWSRSKVVRNALDGTGDYLQLSNKNVLKERHGRAYVGDWVLKTEKGCRSFTEDAFHNAFVPAEDVSHYPGEVVEIRDKPDPNQLALPMLHAELNRKPLFAKDMLEGNIDFRKAKYQPTHGIPLKIDDKVVGTASIDENGVITAQVTDSNTEELLKTQHFSSSLQNFFEEVEAMPEPDPNR